MYVWACICVTESVIVCRTYSYANGDAICSHIARAREPDKHIWTTQKEQQQKPQQKNIFIICTTWACYAWSGAFLGLFAFWIDAQAEPIGAPSSLAWPSARLRIYDGIIISMRTTRCVGRGECVCVFSFEFCVRSVCLEIKLLGRNGYLKKKLFYLFNRWYVNGNN